MYIYIYKYIYIYIYIFIYIYSIYKGCHFKRKEEVQAIFLNPYPFTVCSSCKRKFVVCLFAYEETNGRYPFANGQMD